MGSEFQMQDWIARVLRRPGFQELKPIVREILAMIGGNAVLRTQGDNALITSRPFALLLTAVGGDALQAYCSVHDDEDLDLEKAMHFHFHQYGQPFVESSWVWFPNISSEGPTSYQRRRLHGAKYQYAWSVTRVRPASDTSHVAIDRKGLIKAMGAQIAQDYLQLGQVLLLAFKRD